MPKNKAKGAGSPKGNFVSQWFAHRVYPSVDGGITAVADQAATRCAPLSTATGQERPCVKAPNALGVCAISTLRGGERREWLACPYRALDETLVNDAASRLFAPERAVHVRAAPLVAQPTGRSDLEAAVDAGNTGVLFFQTKLGGEISVSATTRSPEMAFDITMVEVVKRPGGGLALGRYGILEIQTMDFHGSYKHAVKNMGDALRLHGESFPEQLTRRPDWLSEHVEGPNIANVFKRTFYQMVFKFQIGAHPHCAGCIFAIPDSVWESWQRHLGAPPLVDTDDATQRFSGPGSNRERGSEMTKSAFIYVFDLDHTSGRSPSPVRILKRIGTTSEELARLAVEVAPRALVEQGGAADRIGESIRMRLRSYWPELAAR